MSLLAMRGVTRQYSPAQRGVLDISLDVAAGDVVGVVGPNGAGKTTLLRLALGLMQPGSGEVRLWNLDPWRNAPQVLRRVGYAAEKGAQQLSCKLAELLSLHRGLYPTWDDELAMHLLGPLRDKTNTLLDAMSKGQAQRAVLACAMAHRPELLVLDEPAGGLDPSARREFLELAIELLGDGGTTIVLSSHHLSDVERIANRVVMLAEGRVRLQADLDALQEQYCLATLAPSNAGSASSRVEQQLSGVQGFVACRVRNRCVQAVFQADPEPTQAALSDLGLQATCTLSNLEDLFVTVVGYAP